MNEQIKEYRKASAEALFHHKLIRHSIELCEVRYRNEWHIWHPDTDADQMLMVWEYLLKQGCILSIYHWGETSPWRFYVGTESKISKGGDKSIFIATMKAFMEWQRKEEG